MRTAVLVMVVLVAGCGKSKTGVIDPQLLKARELVNEKKYDEALVILEEGKFGGGQHAGLNVNYQTTLLGIIYLESPKHQDLDKAVKQFQSAAYRDFPEAQYYLGYCYYYGVGREKDESEGTKWFNTASNAGDPQAKKKLNELFGNKDLTDK